MPIPTEPIGSIPRPQELIQAFEKWERGGLPDRVMQQMAEEAVANTIQRLEQTASPIITDGEQTKPSFATYPVHRASNLAPGGVSIAFGDGHTRQLPRLVAGPFRYTTYAATYLAAAKKFANRPLKQAVISASALSLLYPAEGIPDYPREQFLDDLVEEAAKDIRGCLDAGAAMVQIDFTEGRLALKLDPSGSLLNQFIELNNRVLARLPPQETFRLGVHSRPGGDLDATHSADVDYAELLPALFRLNVTNFYLQMASEQNREHVLEQIKNLITLRQRVFVGVIDPINPRLETVEEVRDRVLQAARYIPLDQLGTTDDCGFSPFMDDASTARDLAFAKIAARVEGTALASERLHSSSAAV
ncbi:MAG: cobalamin-independent methionine synthase II family protein [Acidobacteriaceae bacterium]|nr:cobalamin-independent methionine synthase II family protein [Acidobacteriaceae bacterium]MBV9499386.1 cobalamin-independent methionine synthase II family protein [Acidobacteriaceae bacterium]